MSTRSFCTSGGIKRHLILVGNPQEVRVRRPATACEVNS